MSRKIFTVILLVLIIVIASLSYGQLRSHGVFTLFSEIFTPSAQGVLSIEEVAPVEEEPRAKAFSAMAEEDVVGKSATWSLERVGEMLVVKQGEKVLLEIPYEQYRQKIASLLWEKTKYALSKIFENFWEKLIFDSIIPNIVLVAIWEWVKHLFTGNRQK